MLKESLVQERKLTKDLVAEKDKLAAVKDDLASERLKNAKIEYELKTANAMLIKSRARLEPRTAIHFCEDNKLPSLGIQGNGRRNIWKGVWGHHEFERHRAIAEEAPSLKSAINKDAEFGRVVDSICTSQNKVIHSLIGNSVVIPQDFDPDQGPVMKAVCDFIPIDYVDEKFCAF